MLCPFSLCHRGSRFREQHKVTGVSTDTTGGTDEQEMNLHVLKPLRIGDNADDNYYQKLKEDDSGIDLNNTQLCIWEMLLTNLKSAENYERHNGTRCPNSAD